MSSIIGVLLVFVILVNCASCFPGKDKGPDTDNKFTGNGRTPSFWRNQAKDELLKYLNLQKTTKVAKNVILFLGDGMSIATVTAARIRQGQLNNKTGEEHVLSWEKFPHVALSKTYNQDHQVPDSAGTATQFLCGVKTNTGVLGVDASVVREKCETMNEGSKVASIVDWSIAKNKGTGIITTTRITHATPGAAYAHTPNRNWEVDWQLENVTEKANCTDIASQLIDKKNLKVVMGGGRRYFLPNNAVDPDKSVGVNSKNGRRDSRNLIHEWKMDKKQRNLNYKYVWNRTQLLDIDHRNTEYIMGLFNSDHMSWTEDHDKLTIPEPTLAEMTEKAIRVLRAHDNDKGFFLLVEGGKIDWAHHYGAADLALGESIAMADAVEIADKLTSDQDTLIIVTADHSHTMSIAGYPQRGNPILDIARDKDKPLLAADNLPYTTLLYADGPGAIKNLTRRNLTGVDTVVNDEKKVRTLFLLEGVVVITESNRITPIFTERNGFDPTSWCNTPNTVQIMFYDDMDFHQAAAIPMDMETHGGDDVAIYARGPMSHLFQGVHEQHYIAHVMAYASCVGEYSRDEDCAASLTRQYKPPTPSNLDSSNHAVPFTTTLYQTIVIVCICLVFLKWV